jgi:hypothetical protein
MRSAARNAPAPECRGSLPRLHARLDLARAGTMALDRRRRVAGFLDILPALKKGGNSLSRRSMSRTEEDILSRVDVPIMRNTTLNTYPASYSELCDPFRPRLGMARRTDSGRERFIHLLVPSPARYRSVTEHASEVRRLASFTSTLCASEFPGQVLEEPRVLDLLPRREGRELYEAQVDADPAAHRPRFRRSQPKTSIFENSKPPPRERHFLLGASGGLSVPEKR